MLWASLLLVLALVGGANASAAPSAPAFGLSPPQQQQYGRISDDEYILTPEQIETFRREGCVVIADFLSPEEVDGIQEVFDRFMSGEIVVPAHDYCDMSKPFGVPREEWSIVNCMLPTRYHPDFQNNVYERLAASVARQLYPESDMTKDYDQLLNKLPGKEDAIFAYHQDMAYWPGAAALGVSRTDTCTFSLAVDDSEEANGCLRYVVGSGQAKALRPHRPLCGDTRSESHALVTDLREDDVEQLVPVSRGSITIHDEWVIHGSGGNTCPDRQRRTYVLAFRAKEIVEAERAIGFTHSHNDEVNWDTFNDGESHRIASKDTEEA